MLVVSSPSAGSPSLIVFFPCGYPSSITSTRAWVSPLDGADRLQVLATM